MIRMWLMALVDRLEAQQARAQVTASALLEALVAGGWGVGFILAVVCSSPMLFSTEPHICTLKDIFSRSIRILKVGCNF